ncbi:MAG: dUTP diphosphatase [Rickettsiales bacterium]|nr:dUTP diphosphatase [Rickettsiales bacterium]|tara:strand:+ start:183 stop:647 length:465 start_codon:yes stop_codon:yes gene_type:complete
MKTTTSLQLVQMEHAKGLDLPHYASAGAAGMDLVAAISEDVTLQPGERTLIETGIKIALPLHMEAQIRPRSGLAFKHGITVINTPGTIDSDYRGEVKVILGNMGTEPFTVERGMRIAQMVIAKHEVAEIELVEVLDDTVRGEGGFGSTGVKKAG